MTGYNDPKAFPPASLLPEAVRAAVARLTTLVNKRREAQRALQALIDQRDAVVAADRQAYAAALDAGKPDPGSKVLEAHDRSIAAAQRDVEALALAIEEAGRGVEKTITDQHDAWTEQAAASASIARQQLATAVDLVANATEALRTAIGVQVFLNNWPHPRQTWLPGMDYLLKFPRKQNDEPYRVGEVLPAIQAYATEHLTLIS